MCGAVFGEWGRTALIVRAGLGLVDRTLALCAHICPIFDARGLGGYLRSCFVVMVGNEERYPRLMACARVDKAGENKALEINSTLSEIVGASITAFNEWEY